MGVDPQHDNLCVFAVVVEAFQLAPRERRVHRNVRVIQQGFAGLRLGLFQHARKDAVGLHRRLALLGQRRGGRFDAAAAANVLDPGVAGVGTTHHVIAYWAEYNHDVLC